MHSQSQATLLIWHGDLPQPLHNAEITLHSTKLHGGNQLRYPVEMEQSLKTPLDDSVSSG